MRTRCQALRRSGCTAVLLAALVVAGCAHAGGPGPPLQREVIAAPGAAVIGPYSPAVRAGDQVFLSGQIGQGEGPAGIGVATRQALEAMGGVMALAGVRSDQLVKCNVFLTDMADFAGMNAAYVEWFGDAVPPARTTVAAAALPAGARIEITCVAYAPRR
jgi:2-iminobutanoate/2-iminopropanoate deaminase